MTKYENSKGSIFCSSNQIIENPRARSPELCPAHSVSPCPVARANSRLAAAIVVVLVVSSSSSSSSSSPRSSHGPRRCCECRRKAKLGHPLSSFGCSPFAFVRLERRGERGREERGEERRESEQTNGRGRGRGRQSGPNICSRRRRRLYCYNIYCRVIVLSKILRRPMIIKRRREREEDISMLKS